MMATTHALVGLLVGTGVGLLAPDLAPAALAAGLVGGVAPDLDVFATHRRTLHVPVLGPALPPLAALPALVAPGPWTVGLAVFVAAAALHAAMDVVGGGLGLEPWRSEDDRAVYSHVLGRWLRARGPISYDGSLGDLLLAVGLGLPVVALAPAPGPALAGLLLLVSMGYVLVRRRLVAIVARLVALVPRQLRWLLPARMRQAYRRH